MHREEQELVRSVLKAGQVFFSFIFSLKKLSLFRFLSRPFRSLLSFHRFSLARTAMAEVPSTAQPAAAAPAGPAATTPAAAPSVAMAAATATPVAPDPEPEIFVGPVRLA